MSWSNKVWCHDLWMTDCLPQSTIFEQCLQNSIPKIHELKTLLPPLSAPYITADDIVHSHRLEGEHYEYGSVVNSFTRRIGISAGSPSHLEEEKLIDFLDAVNQLPFPRVTSEAICAAHKHIPSLSRHVKGRYRKACEDPMQIVDGRGRVYYEAPPAETVSFLMEKFFSILETLPLSLSTAAWSHFVLLTIHPFVDGNGRFSRAFEESILLQSKLFPTTHGYLAISMSKSIYQHRKHYYHTLTECQNGRAPIEQWYTLWTRLFTYALDQSISTVQKLQYRSFMIAHLPPFSPAQKTMFNRFFNNWEGHVTTEKWVKITKVSPSTAKREIKEFHEWGILFRHGTTKSTSYTINPHILE